MKYRIYTILILFISMQLSVQAQNEDTKIPFNKGVLKLCSTKNFKIKGHDGKDVIIKSLAIETSKNGFVYRAPRSKSFPARVATRVNRATTSFLYKTGTRIDSIESRPFIVGSLGNFEKEKRGEGLKKLGKKAAARDNGIFLQIEQDGDVLTITDDHGELFYTVTDQTYELLVPNTVKLQWDTSGCTDDTSKRFVAFNTESSELTDFKGEVEISTSLQNLNLVDVSGPVTINTIGGNVTVAFNKTKPEHLYSIYSNNGFIDIKIPTSSGVSIDASGNEILSNLDFNVESETDTHEGQQMKLKLGNGKVKMKLDAGMGNIYLRKE